MLKERARTSKVQPSKIDRSLYCETFLQIHFSDSITHGLRSGNLVKKSSEVLIVHFKELVGTCQHVSDARMSIYDLEFKKLLSLNSQSKRSSSAFKLTAKVVPCRKIAHFSSLLREAVKREATRGDKVIHDRTFRSKIKELP